VSVGSEASRDREYSTVVRQPLKGFFFFFFFFFFFPPDLNKQPSNNRVKEGGARGRGINCRLPNSTVIESEPPCSTSGQTPIPLAQGMRFSLLRCGEERKGI